MLVTYLEWIVFGIGLIYFWILVLLIVNYIQVRTKAVEGVFDELTRWFIFSASFSLLPILFNFIRIYNRTTEIEIRDLVSHGELFLIATTISCSALGVLLG